MRSAVRGCKIQVLLPAARAARAAQLMNDTHGSDMGSFWSRHAICNGAGAGGGTKGGVLFAG
eukprot:2259442-Prymnesium_polylepis.1